MEHDRHERGSRSSVPHQRDDVGDSDAGDNYQANIQLIAATLERELRGSRSDVGQALLTALRALHDQGRGGRGIVV